MDACARLRSGLEVSEQRAGEATVYVVKDPASGRIFRLPATAYFIARQLDGRTPPEEIRGRVEKEFGAAPSREELDGYLLQLSRLGLVDGAASPTARAGRVRGDLLYLRFKAFDPDRFLERLLPRFRWCFTRSFAGVSVALVVCAFAVAVANWQEIRPEFARLAELHALFYVWVVLIVSVCAHEIAHGLACKRFGGRVREMGLMLIYFQPALYCNVSDAWMFPEKAKRLWVTAAGAWFDMVLWALAVFVWRITEPDAALHFAALVVLATVGVRMAFNINPLIKLDGYYLLSDALDIPNLRARAFGYLGGFVQGVSARERRIFVAYGILAGLYTTLLLGG